MKTHYLLGAVALATFAGSTACAQVVLDIDQVTGLVGITNTSATDTVNINGYTIRSVQSGANANDGLLNPAGWSDLETSLGVGWLATNFPSSESLLETNANGLLSLAPGTSQSLGAAFTVDPAVIAAAQSRVGFGAEYLDVTFDYTDADSGSSVVSGGVSYQNEVFNNLVLNIDTGTGIGELVNESADPVTIEAFIINSVAGSLDTGWNGLSDTVANWEQNVGTANALAELSSLDPASGLPGAPLNPLTISGGDSFELGSVFTLGSARDLAFTFLQVSEAAGSVGEVRYVGLVGDYNNDGIVGPADYAVWRDALGSTAELFADGSGNGIVDQADYDLWVDNFGATRVLSTTSTAIPEPGASLLAALTTLIAIIAHPHRLSKDERSGMV